MRTYRFFAIPLLLLLLALVSWAEPDRKSAESQAERAKLTRHEQAYLKAKRAYESDAKRPAAKRKSLVEATVQFGATTMLSPVLAPRVKYPRALKLFNEALKLDPKHVKAKEYKDMIVAIYRSMGRPVPKG